MDLGDHLGHEALVEPTVVGETDVGGGKQTIAGTAIYPMPPHHPISDPVNCHGISGDPAAREYEPPRWARNSQCWDLFVDLAEEVNYSRLDSPPSDVPM